MEAYVYAADMLCGSCAAKVREDLKTAPGWSYAPEDYDGPETWTGPMDGARGTETFNVEGLIIRQGRPIDGTDTDTFPNGPHLDGGGESDSPQHCSECHVFLENPLTGDGVDYVAGTLKRDLSGGLLHSVAVQTWASFYRDELRDLNGRRAIGSALIQALDLGLAVHAMAEALEQSPIAADCSPQPSKVLEALKALKAEAQGVAQDVDL